MAAGHKQATTRPQNSASLKKARHIGIETWNMWKNDVYDRYIIQNQPLDQIMQDYGQKYNFHGTKKQWKDQLTRWQFRKRLNKEDAAYILYLLREADTQGLQRRVFFNETERTLEDILSYVRKSDLIHSQDQLMQHLDLEDPSPYITCVEDGDDLVPHQTSPDAFTPDVLSQGLAPTGTAQQVPDSQMIHNWQPAVPAQTPEPEPLNASIDVEIIDHSPSFFGEEHQIAQHASHYGGIAMHRPTSSSSAGFEEVRSVPSVESLSSQASGLESPSPDGFAPYESPPYQAAVPCLHNFGPLLGPEGIVRIPRNTLPNPMIHQGDPQMMNDLLSNSPIQMNLSTQALSERIDAMFGKIETIGSDTHAIDRVALFLRHSCAALIFGGQQYPQDYWHSISQAVYTFTQVMLKNPWDSLTTLNHMLAMLTQYGHRIAIQDILGKVNEAVADFRKTYQQPMFAVVVQSVLDFMTMIPALGYEPEYDIESLSVMEQRARSCFTHRPEFELSATYVHAWGLLEMKHAAEALQKLSDLRAGCEEVFGYSQCQTISWISTLARAYAANGQKRMAANTYRDVAGRIKICFGDAHPHYWDSRFRQACFDMKDFDNYQDERKQRLGWLGVAQDLREALVWRARNLGEFNPHTLQNLKAFRHVLKKLNKMGDFATFEQIMNVDLS